MYNRIYSFLCKHKLINTTQFGFRSKHSTEHALISLIETIKKYLDDGEIVCGVFIDSQKAFDTVNHEILLEKLKHYGIRSKQNDWFRSFLTNRKQYVSMEGFFSQTKIVKCGVPQASTLGPLLFLIYINNLANALEKSIVHHFADDTNLLYGNKNPSVISDVINSELKLVTDWLRANKLSLNESKTKLLLFRPINKLNLTLSNIKLNGHLLTLAKSVTYLGALRLMKLYVGTTKLRFLQKNSAELTESSLNLDITFQQNFGFQYTTTFFSCTFYVVQQFGAIHLNKI